MKNTVYKNASIVTGISVAERGLGFLYRVVLSRYIGAEGLGLYQVAASILALLSTLLSGGLPVTLSRTVAKRQAEGDENGAFSVLSAGLLLSLCLLPPLGGLFWLLGKNTTLLFSDERSFQVFEILLLGLAFSAIYAAVRGYFWGKKQFLTASLLEMTEEIVMVLAGIFLLRGVTSPLNGAIKTAWATTISDLLACAVALVCFFLFGGRFANPKKELKPLFNSSLPITSVRASGSLVNSAVAILFPLMLVKSGLSTGEATGLFGVVSGMVLPVLFIPSTLIGSLALVLVPELSENYHRRDEKALRKNIGRGLSFSFLIACALLPPFFVLGEEFGCLAFSSSVAGEIIVKSCPILLPMSITMISTSILNSIGFEKQTFVFFFLGASALLLSVLLLPPLCGVYAYVVGLGASYTVTAICNLVCLRKKCPFLFKRGGQVCVQLIFPALIGVLPLSVLGNLFQLFCGRFAGELLGVLLTLSFMIFSTLLYYLSPIFPYGKKFWKEKATKKSFLRKKA